MLSWNVEYLPLKIGQGLSIIISLGWVFRNIMVVRDALAVLFVNAALQ